MGNLNFNADYYSLIEIHYVKEPQENCAVLLAYAGEALLKAESVELLRKELTKGCPQPVTEYQLYFYNKKELQQQFNCEDETEIDSIELMKEIYQRTGLSLDHVDMNAGNRYLIVQGKALVDIIYLGCVDGRYHYILTNDFGKRFNKIDRGHFDPQNLKRRKTINYIKKPIVFGDMGPFWAPNCFRIENNKIQPREENKDEV